MTLNDIALALGRLLPDGDGAIFVEHPGCIVIYEPYPDARLQWWFGTANGTWAGDLMKVTCEGEQHLETRDTGVPAACTDAQEIAQAIADALLKTHLGVVGHLDDGERYVVCPRCAAVQPLPGTLVTGRPEPVAETKCDDCNLALDLTDASALLARDHEGS